MKILTVSHSYPRWDGDVAGAFIHRLNLGLTARGHSIRVLVPADRGARGDYRLDGILVSRVAYAAAANETLAYTGAMARSVRSPGGFLAFQSLVRRQAAGIRAACGTGIDLVHAHWWVPGGLSTWFARRGKTPYVVTAHGTDVAILERSRAARVLARRVFGGAGGISAVSNFLAGRLGELVRADVSQLTVQPMPLDVDLFVGRESGGRGVVTVGRLTRQKRIDVVLRAYQLLRERGFQLPLRVIGDGPERERLEELARGFGISVEAFVGEVPPAEIPGLVAGSDVFAFAAEGEGLGLVTAEAMMLGTPVAAVRSGGVPDLVPPGGAGRLVPQGDAEALAAAMAELLEHPAESRTAALQHGMGLARLLSSDTAAAATEAMYRRVVAQ